MSIKQAILEKSNGEELAFKDYQNLILDDQPVQSISSEDKSFLELFSECRLLSLNNCQLKQADNLPRIHKLEQLELETNFIENIPASLIKELPNLVTLKISNNKIKTVSDLAPLKQCSALRVLDLSKNPLSENKEYIKKVRDLLPQLDVLDGKDKDG